MRYRSSILKVVDEIKTVISIMNTLESAHKAMETAVQDAGQFTNRVIKYIGDALNDQTLRGGDKKGAGEGLVKIKIAIDPMSRTMKSSSAADEPAVVDTRPEPPPRRGGGGKDKKDKAAESR